LRKLPTHLGERLVVCVACTLSLFRVISQEYVTPESEIIISMKKGMKGFTDYNSIFWQTLCHLLSPPITNDPRALTAPTPQKRPEGIDSS
jgi:hypothetical protein